MAGNTGGTSFFPLCFGNNTLSHVLLLGGVLQLSTTCFLALPRGTFSAESTQSTGVMLAIIS